MIPNGMCILRVHNPLTGKILEPSIFLCNNELHLQSLKIKNFITEN